MQNTKKTGLESFSFDRWHKSAEVSEATQLEIQGKREEIQLFLSNLGTL